MTLDLKLEEDMKTSGRTLTEREKFDVENLGILASGGALPEKPEEFLARLGWFGTFVVADQSKHDAIVQSAKDKMVLIGSIFRWFACLVSLVLLVCL